MYSLILFWLHPLAATNRGMDACHTLGMRASQMKPNAACSVIVLLCFVTAVAAREWSDSTGQYKVEAEFVGLALRTHDGKIISVPLERLSQADRDFVREQISKGAREAGLPKPHVELSDSSWATIGPGRAEPKIQLDDGKGTMGLPKTKPVSPKPNTYFFLVECTIDIHTCPKKKVDFLKAKNGKNVKAVNIGKDEIVLRTRDGLTIAPTYAAFMKLSAGKWQFSKGPLRNVVVTEQEIVVGGKHKRSLHIQIARLGAKPNEVLAERFSTWGQGDDSDLSTVDLCFAFEVPSRSEVDRVVVNMEESK